MSQASPRLSGPEAFLTASGIVSALYSGYSIFRNRTEDTHYVDVLMILLVKCL